MTNDNKWTVKLEKLAENQRRSILLFFLLSLLFYVGIGQVHLFDWDEINFAESAREMIESNNYLRVQINYLPFWEKPPFFFWLQVASMKLFGVNEFAARFPNALLGFIYMTTLYLIGKKHFGAKLGFIWSFLFTASLLPQVYFKSGIIDPLFNFFIFLSIYFMAVVLSEKGSRKIYLLAILSGLFSGMSVITKGPVGFLLLGLTLFVYLIATRFKTFPSIKKIVFFLLGFSTIIIFWLSLEVAQNGFDILAQFIAYQVDLFNKPVAGHAQPFYYHFVVVFFGCFPISILALPMLFKRKEGLVEIDFIKWNQILFWSVIILFSIVTTKIIHYSSMTYLPLSFLAAWQVHKYGLKRILRVTYIVLGILLSILFIVIPFLFIHKELLYPVIHDQFALLSLKAGPDLSYGHLLYTLPFLGGLILGARLIKSNRKLEFALVSSLSTSITFAFLMYFFLPKVEATTQGSGIEFAESLAGKDVYFDAIGYKSYIPYFYGKVPYRKNDKSKDQDWLIDGDIDKPVYFLSKYDYLFLESRPYFRRVGEKGGFTLWKREVPQ